MSFVGGAAFFALAISVLICGWLADRWITSTGNATLVLKFFCGGALQSQSIAFLAVFLIPDHTIAMAILIFSCIALGMCSPNLWTMTQILAGAQTAGRWTGLRKFLRQPRRHPRPSAGGSHRRQHWRILLGLRHDQRRQPARRRRLRLHSRPRRARALGRNLAQKSRRRFLLL